MKFIYGKATNKLKRLFKFEISIATILLILIPNVTYSYPLSSYRIGSIRMEPENYQLLIISPQKYRSILQHFIEHKEQRNISTKMVTLNEILEGKYFPINGRDPPEKIKYFIKNAYDEWNIKYVLLFGSIRDIPTCYCWNNDNFSDYPEPYFISDLYYADIYDSKGDFSSWDTDNDGIYGEWNGRKAEDYNISLKPEISIGRLACKSRIEAKTVVKKIIEYENNKEKEWFKRITLVGGDELSNITGHYGKKYRAHEGELLCDKVANIMNDFENIKLYVSKNNLDPHGINVVKNINKGCGFLYIPSHGNPMSLATYGDNGSSKITILSTCYSPLLVNQEKLPIAILGGCHSNQIDVTPFNILWGLIKEGWKYFHLPTEEDETFGDFWKYEWVPECIGWRLISNPHGGAIATIGCTGLGWKGIEINREDGLSDWLEIQFFREYKNGTRILGDIWRNCITKYLETFPINWSASSGSVSCLDAKTVEEWILLGDPTLEIG